MKETPSTGGKLPQVLGVIYSRYYSGSLFREYILLELRSKHPIILSLFIIYLHGVASIWWPMTQLRGSESFCRSIGDL